jgi:flagellar protein FliO/FliZ
MTLDTGPWMQAGAALAGVLLLLWLGARALRASGVAAREGRRLGVQEVLAVDARRRLLLLRCDGRELLLLTGGGGGADMLLGWLPGKEEAP